MALVEPSAAATFSRITEFCEKRMLALPTLKGWVIAGLCSWAFCKAPLPLKLMAAEFFMGPAACICRFKVPLPVTPSAAETP